MNSMLKLILIFFLPLFLYAQNQTALQDLGQLASKVSNSPTIFNGSVVNGSYMYTAGDGKVYIYSVTDPVNPVFIKTVPSLSGVERVWSGEGFLFVYTGSSIKIYDLTDPVNPLFKSNYTSGVDLHKVDKRGNYMLVLYMYNSDAGKNGSFEIVDISNPANPQLKGTYKPENCEGRSFLFSPQANRVYVAHYNFSTSQGLIKEIDYSNPSSLIYVREKTITGSPKEISIADSILFVLKDAGWQGPSTLEAYNIKSATITDITSLQVSSGQAWDMHVYGNSITLTLLENTGFKNFTWDGISKTFTPGPTLNILNASQISWYMISTETEGGKVLRKQLGGYWVYFYYYVLEKSDEPMHESDTRGYYTRLVEMKIWVETPDEAKVTLITSVAPDEAAADGCTVTPAGTNKYNKNSTATLQAQAGTGWVFDKWTGSLTGSQNPQDLKMDDDKNVVGNFQPLLTLNLTSPADNFLCLPGQNEELTIATANIFVDGVNWLLMGISFSVIEKFKPNFTEAWIEYSGTKLKGMITTDADSFATSLSFSLNKQINEGTTLPVRLFYKFNYPSKVVDKYVPPPLDEVKKYRVSINVGQVDCLPIPESARPGVKTPIYPPNIFYSNTQTVALVWNTSKSPGVPFTSIQEAVSSSLTHNGDVIELCPCLFEENIDINKSLTIRSKQGKEVTYVTAKNSADNVFEISSDEVELKGLTIKGASGSVKAAVTADYSMPSSATAKKLTISSSDIFENWWGVFIQGPENSSPVTGQITIDNCNISNNNNNGITTTGLKLNLAVNNSVAGYNKNGIQSGGNVDITNSTINFNRECGVSSEGKIGILSEKNFITDISNNDLFGINAGRYCTKVSIKCLDNSGAKIQNNGSHGILSPSSLVSGNNLDVSYNGRLDPQWGSGIYALNVDLMNVKINQNKGNGIDAFCGLGVQADGNNISEISDNDGSGIIVGAGAASAVIRGLENGWIKINNNGEYGVWTRNANFRGENFEIIGSGRLKPDNGTAITAFNVDIINAKINLNKGDGIFSYGDVGLQAVDNSITECSSNDGIGIYSGKSGAYLTLRGLDNSWVWIKNNGRQGVVSDRAKVNGSNIVVSSNGRTEASEGEGIKSLEADLESTVIENNKSDGVNCGVLKYQNGSVRNNNGWGISIYGKPTLTNINPGVSITENSSGGILFKQSANNSVYNSFQKYNASSLFVINGCSLSNNQGNGIRNESSDNFSVINSNISGNGEFGINNINAGSSINAQNNWWGSNSGPGGLGAGTGDKVSPNVSFAGWLAKPISVIIACNKDTSYSTAGGLDTVEVSFKNHIRIPDKLNIVVTDSLGWLTASKIFSLDLPDSNCVKTNFTFSIPVGAAASTLNRIKIKATSELDGNLSYETSIYNIIYNPSVAQIEILPTTVNVGQNNKTQFTAKCYDQNRKIIAHVPTWSASKGAIDNNGLFTAPSDTGWCNITAKVGTNQAIVNVHVVSSESFLSRIVIVPDSVMINRHAKQQFYALGFDQFDSTYIFEPVWTATGGVIDQLGLFTAGDVAGNYLIAAKDNSELLNCNAKVVITQLVGIEQIEISTEYFLSQNYPNPFNPTTNINYSLPFESKVRIEVFNILGQRVDVLADEVQSAGYKIIQWDATKFASGVYLVRMIAQPINTSKTNFVSIKKLLHIK